MPFIGKTPETGAFRLIDSITTSATDTYALTVQGDHYFPESARNLIVSLNGVTQAPETAYTVSGSHIVFASALTASDVIDYILVIGDAVDIGTPSDGTVGNAQLKASLDLSGKTLTFSNDQISGDAVDGGTISNFASTGIDDNATSTAITIDSSQNVAIGSAVTPSYGKVRIESGLELHASQQLNIVTGNTNPFELVNRSAGGLDFYPTGTVRAMRLDASGNVLVGTTSFSTTTRGIKLDADGDIAANQDGQAVAFFGRLTSDGDIAVFRKDGTTVGSIASVVSSYIQVGSGDTGVVFNSGVDAIIPHTGSATRDAAIDLGLSSGRFKNLYLSGGAYLGGTGAVNHLDHYEEGTWTPTLVAVGGTKTWTYNAQVGYFTRIGRQVTVWFNIQLSSNGSGTDGNARITGLPFNSGNLTNLVGNYAVFWKQLIETADVALMGRNPNSQSYIDLIDGSASYPDIAYINTSVLTFDRRIRGTLTYQV